MGNVCFILNLIMKVDCTRDGVDHSAEDGGGLNELFEDVRLCGQWEAIIQHLLQ